MRDMWQHPLGRHLVVILLVKLLAIWLIWFAFFRPVTPALPVTPEQVGAELVGNHSAVTAGIIPSSHSSGESVK